MDEIKLFKDNDKNKIIEFNKLVHSGNIEYHIENLLFKNPFNSVKDFAYIEVDGKIAAMIAF